MNDEDAMYGAIARRDKSAVQELLARDPSILDVYAVKKSWLHWAAQKGYTEIMEVLAAAGIEIDRLTSDGASTPLNVAAALGEFSACEWLLDKGADINRGLGRTATPIFSAIYSGSRGLVQLFIERGADLTASFGDPKRDVSSYAKIYGTKEIADLLREAIEGANRGDPPSSLPTDMAK